MAMEALGIETSNPGRGEKGWLTYEWAPDATPGPGSGQQVSSGTGCSVGGGPSKNLDPATVQSEFAATGGSYGAYRVGSNGCTTIPAWFIGAKTNLTYGHGNGWQVAQKLVDANPSAGLAVSDIPRAPAIFSTYQIWSSAMCGSGGAPNGKCGHTGLVLSVDEKGTVTILTTHSGLGGMSPYSNIETHSKSEYDGKVQFVYVGDNLK
jgi:surface antigen